MAGHGGDPVKVVKAALLANAGIAIAKFVAAYFSGSTTMLAEGVHSVADTANQALLWVGIILSARRADARFPLGRASESYFWSFIVALLLFFLGGVFAIYEGAHKLAHPEPPGNPLAPIGVLVVSIFLEGSSFLVAWREFQKMRGKRTLRQALFDGKDPVIPVVLLEDTGAIFGLLFALVAVVVSWVTGSGVADGVGSIVIGILLCVIGLLLAKDTRSLLIGEGVTLETRMETISIVEGIEGVKSVRQLLSLHLGPDTVLLALKVRFADGLSLEEVEKVTDRLEEAVRAKLPMMKRIFVEPDSDYDAALDADAPREAAS
ncbi:MAG: cation transporter [Polyangiaceae bacterium]|nr:cation transporter [Polyangiaceae bacterium]